MGLFLYESTGFLEPVCFWSIWAHLTDMFEFADMIFELRFYEEMIDFEKRDILKISLRVKNYFSDMLNI